jgi:glyoxylase-like metal-dependent hydrolase (beta-lactamase superfamily II)
MAGARALHVFHTGFFHAPRRLFTGERGFAAMPVLAFAIELADGSFVLVDAGVDSTRRGRLRALRSKVLRTLSGAVEQPDWSHSRRLASLGIAPERVRALAMTHLDYDHTGGLPHLAPGVPVYVSRAEWRPERPTPFDRLRRTPADFAALRHVREVEFERDGVLPGGVGARALPEAAGAATLVSLAGHSAGHAGVLVALASGRRVLLAGDACYFGEQVTARRPLGALARFFARDVAAALRTLEDLRRWADADPALRVIPSHDPAVGALCAERPLRIE